MRKVSRRYAMQKLVGMYGASRILGGQQASPVLEPVNVMDFAVLAQKKMDPVAWDYLAGGSEEEASLRDNLAGYQKIILRPKVLTGVGKIDTSLELFGLKLDYPILLDPTGGKNCFFPNGEIVVAGAAAREKAVYVSNAIAKFTGKGNGPANFYLTTNLTTTTMMKTLVKRAEEQGASALSANNPQAVTRSTPGMLHSRLTSS
jgi:4-hydroxymandelate oxidase